MPVRCCIENPRSEIGLSPSTDATDQADAPTYLPVRTGRSPQWYQVRKATQRERCHVASSSNSDLNGLWCHHTCQIADRLRGEGARHNRSRERCNINWQLMP